MKKVVPDVKKPSPKETRPLVSIGIPVFNGERYLEEALRSVLSQTWTNLEILIADNMSDDSTPEIIRRYALLDSRITWFRNASNIGAAANYNLVFTRSRGTYFKWASYDDLIDPDFIRVCVETLEKNPDAVLCYPKTVLISASGSRIRQYDDRCNLDLDSPDERLGAFFRNCRLCNPVFGVIRSDVLRRTALHGAFIAADYVLLTELALLGKFIEYPEYMFYRRDHDTNVRKLEAKERALWFSPKATKWAYTHPDLNLFLRLHGTVWRVGIPFASRLFCFLRVNGWGIRRVRTMVGALRRAWAGKPVVERVKSSS